MSIQELNTNEIDAVAGGFFFFCKPRYVCQPKPVCAPKPVCQPKPVCAPKPSCQPKPKPGCGPVTPPPYQPN